MFPVALNSRQDISRLLKLSMLKTGIYPEFCGSLKEMDNTIHVTPYQQPRGLPNGCPQYRYQWWRHAPQEGMIHYVGSQVISKHTLAQE